MQKNYRLYSDLPNDLPPRVWAEIDLDALRYNYRYLRAKATEQDANVRAIAVVKADAYGHGADACARALLAEGCDFFAVACIEEAIALRKTCRSENREADILILGYTAPSLAPTLAQYNLIQALLSPSHAREISDFAARAGVCVRAHVAVDTGMNRIGFCAHTPTLAQDSAKEAARLRAISSLSLEGAFTHFSRADEVLGAEGEAFTDLQSHRYRTFQRELESLGVFLPFHHICNTAAAWRRPADRLQGVRFGISLYGACPSEALSHLALRPVMKLKTLIAHIHTLPAREGLSYGGCFSATEERVIATLPIGYADGLSRAYSGAYVTVHTKNGNERAPIVGRVCMDQCMIDITNTHARERDTVTVFGSDTRELASLAAQGDTVDYEVLCRISARVPRVYPKNGDEKK